jgi:hypothetical protein
MSYNADNTTLSLRHFESKRVILEEGVNSNGRGKLTASSLSADGYPLMASPNFQPSDGNPTVISILWQLADGPDNVPEM